MFKYGDTLWEAAIHNDEGSREEYEELDVGIFGSEVEARHAAAVALVNARRYYRDKLFPMPTFAKNHHFRLKVTYRRAMVWDTVLGKQYAYPNPEDDR